MHEVIIQDENQTTGILRVTNEGIGDAHYFGG